MAKEPNLTEQIAMQLDNVNVSFDPKSFDDQAINKGSELEHWANLPCANYNFDAGDVRSSHTEACCGGSGRVYFFRGIIQGIFTQVNKSNAYYAGGNIDNSSVYLIIPRFYKDSQEHIIASPYDRLVPKCSDGTLFVVYWEQTNISPNGIDYLSYPVQKVEYLVDGSGKRYLPDVDFTVKNGAIVWGANRPSTSLFQNQGAAYSIRYYIQAAYLVNSCMHDIRTIRTADPISGELLNVRYPQYLQIMKEVNFLANKKNIRAGNLSDHFAAESSAY
jgi:hypothetical protein